MRLGRDRSLVGDLPGALSSFVRAAEAATAEGDASLFAEGCARAAAKRSQLGQPADGLSVALKTCAGIDDTRARAVVRDCEAQARYHEQRPQEALRAAKDAWADYDMLGLSLDRDRISCGIAQCYLDLGHLDAAREWTALLLESAADTSPLLAYGLFSRGRLRHFDGDLAGAREDYESASRLGHLVGDANLLGHLGYWEGELWLREGVFGRASVAFRSAQRWFEASGDDDNKLASAVGMALCDQLDGDLEGAAAIASTFVSARASSAAVEAVLALRRSQLDGVEPRRTAELARSCRGPDGRPLVESSALYRSAMSSLRRMSRRSGARPPSPAVRVEGDLGRLRVGEDSVEVRGPMLRALLQCLLERRQASPGAWISRESLGDELWPRERMLASARSNRTKVLVSRLRAAGLGSLVQTGPRGVRLDPTVSFFTA